MKKASFIPILFILMYCNQKNTDCAKFHEGQFKTNDPNYGTTYITRKGNIQTEINNDIGYSVKLLVKWENDCKYTLRLLEVLENKPNIPYDSTMFMTVQITGIKKNSYLQVTSSNKSDQIYKSEIVQLSSKN